MPEEPVENYLFNTVDRRQFKLISTPESDKSFAIIERTVDENGRDIETFYPWAEAELPDEPTGKFVLRVFDKAKDTVMEHPKSSAAFTLATVITGVATAILVTRHKRKK